jgi:hypothetical protein
MTSILWRSPCSGKTIPQRHESYRIEHLPAPLTLRIATDQMQRLLAVGRDRRKQSSAGRHLLEPGAGQTLAGRRSDQ